MKKLMIAALLMTAASVANANRLDDALKALDDEIGETHRLEMKYYADSCKRLGGPTCAVYRAKLEEQKQMLEELKQRQDVLDRIERK